MEMAEWRELLSGEPSKERWEEIVQAVRKDWAEREFRDVVMPYLQEHLASWPLTLRTAPLSFLRHPRSSAEWNIALLARYFDGVRSDDLIVDDLATRLKYPFVIELLSLIDDSEWSGHMDRLLRKKYAKYVRALLISQSFGADGFGAVLASSMYAELEHFYLDVEGYEAYCDPHGFSATSKINKPRLRSFGNSYYPLDPARVSVLRKAKLPVVEAADLNLIAGGGLKELVTASWFPQLHTFQFQGTYHGDSNYGTDYKLWLATNLPGFRADADDYEEQFLLEDGRSRFDFDVEALALAPQPLGLRRLSLKTERGGPVTMVTVEALERATSLPLLEQLWLPLPNQSEDVDREEIRQRLLNTEALPALRDVQFHPDRDLDASKAWFVEGDDAVAPVYRTPGCVIDLRPPATS